MPAMTAEMQKSYEKAMTIKENMEREAKKHQLKIRIDGNKTVFVINGFEICVDETCDITIAGNKIFIEKKELL